LFIISKDDYRFCGQNCGNSRGELWLQKAKRFLIIKGTKED